MSSEIYADKEKIQALINKQRINPADLTYIDLDTAAKIVKEFENPSLRQKKSASAPRLSDGKDMADALEAEDTLQAKMFNAKMILADRRSDDLQARDAAAKALAARTRQILGAMNVRKKYDKSRLKSLTSMMRVMMGTILLTPEMRAYIEVENIELSPEETSESSKGHPAVDREVNPWLSGAKLLEGVEKSYDKGKKLLDESQKSGLEANKSEGLTNGEGGADKVAEVELVSEGEIRSRAEEVAGEIGGSVRVVRGASDMERLESYRRSSEATRARMRNAKGWYDPVTGEVVVNAGAHRSPEDMVRTVLHEEIGHKGLETVMGEEAFGRLVEAVFERGDAEVRRGIAELMGKNGWDYREATREYMARLAEKVDRDGVNSLSSGARRIWEALKAQVTRFLSHIFRGMELPSDIEISEKMLSEMLRQVYERRKREAKGDRGVIDVFSEARESVRRSEWSNLNERGEGIRFEGEGERPDPEGPKGGKPTSEDTKNPTWKAKTVALSDSPSRAEAPGYVPSLSKSDGAKLQKISDNLQTMSQEILALRL